MDIKEKLKHLNFLNMGKSLRELETVFLTGAGVSAASGIKTFRDNGGLWEEHNIYEVATPEAWESNPVLVQTFYNQRRKQLLEVLPNGAHDAIADLEKKANVTVVTQNVDDLHERAGSSRVLHLHGELRKSRSSVDSELIYSIDGWEIKMGELCDMGSQLRPHVVWFGEAVPLMAEAERVVEQADLLIVAGTSLNVYPAAGLLYNVSNDVPILVVDPSEMDLKSWKNTIHLKGNAEEILPELVDYLTHIFK